MWNFYEDNKMRVKNLKLLNSFHAFLITRNIFVNQSICAIIWKWSGILYGNRVKRKAQFDRILNQTFCRFWCFEL